MDQYLTKSVDYNNHKPQMQRKKGSKKLIRSRIISMIILCLICFLLGRASSIMAQNDSNSNNSMQRIDIKGKQIENSSIINDWKLVLVNPWEKISDDYPVELTTLSNGNFIDKGVFKDLQDMMDACRADGLSPIICSSYRTMEKQQSLFNNQVNKYISRGYSTDKAKTEAAKWVAVPGTSEHQTGLAVDIVASSYQLLDEEQEKTAEQQWLMKNCHKYGFIIRYPSNKTDITGIGYEPWHYRYVGKEAAEEIMKNDICLEEYLKGNE